MTAIEHDPDPAATHQDWMNQLAAIAVCARCHAEGSSVSGEFTWSRRYDEFTCTDMTACDDRAADQEARQSQ